MFLLLSISNKGALASLLCYFADNDIDGEVLLMLEESDIAQLIPSIGARRKFTMKIKKVTYEVQKEVGPKLTKIDKRVCNLFV